jgi:hypothetical protein
MPNSDDVGDDPLLTPEQAYEAAYRFIWQYAEREPIEPFQLMLVAMEPVPDPYRTSDPASWSDWERCVSDTLAGSPLPIFPRSTAGDEG